MKRHAIFALLTLVAGLLCGRAAATPVTAAFTPFTLAYGNDIRGELAPCG